MKTPAWKDFKGFYNAGEPHDEGIEHLDNWQESTPESARVQPRFPEILAVFKLFAPIEAKLKAMSGSISYDARSEDRTAFLTVIPATKIDFELLDILQEDLKRRAPNWRVIVGDCEDDSSIAVYPTAIVYPRSDISKEAALADVVRRLYKDQLVEQEREAFHEKQNKLALCLTQQISPLPKPPYHPKVLFATRRETGRGSSILVWILEPGFSAANRSWLPDEVELSGFQGCTSVKDKVLGVSGSPLKKFKGFSDPSIYGIVLAASYDATVFRNEIMLIDPDTKAEVPFPIPAEKILTKEQVSAMLENFEGSQKKSLGANERAKSKEQRAKSEE